MKKKGGKNI
jgi:hypothetical protein